MNYETLKAAVADVIKTNGNEEITGQLLQDVLIAIINALGSGYQFMGIATAETTPGTPDQRVFYLAGSAGSTALPGFGITVDHEICVLMYSDEWEKQTLLQFDSVLTSGSQNLVTSGMVYDAVANLTQAINGLAEIVGGHTTAIESLQETVGGHTTAIESLQETVGGHTTAINNLQYAVIAIQAAIESLQTDVAQKIDKSDADSLVVGSAQGVLATSAVEAFFLFQQSGATGDGAALIPTIKGKTIAWNQMITKISAYFTFDGTEKARGSIGLNSSDTIKTIVGHKYLMVASVKTTFTGAITWKERFLNSGVEGTQTLTGNGVVATIDTCTSVQTAPLSIFNDAAITPANGDTLTLTLHDCFDLTLMFGAGNEPSTVAEFEALYPELDYPYNAGKLRNNDASALETVGRNLFDGESALGYWGANGWVSNNSVTSAKNLIRVLPSTTYYAKKNSQGDILFYDANGGYLDIIQNVKDATFTTPAGCAYIGVNWCYDNGIDCINLSDASFNGTYEPYWKRVLALRISELTGIPEGGTEDDRVTMFPNGLGGAGSAYDLLYVENGVTKARKTMLTEVDLGDLGWTKTSVLFRAPLSGSKLSGYFISTDPKMIWRTQSSVSGNPGTYEAYINSNGNLDMYYPLSDYADGAAFKAAMTGVKLIAEAATPIVYTDLRNADGTPFELPKGFKVGQGGTERAIQPEGATEPSAPFSAEFIYPVNPIETCGESLKNLLEAMKTAGVISAYTMTWNENTQQYEFTITQ